MIKKFVFCSALSLCLTTLSAQIKLQTTVSSDSILLGNTFTLSIQVDGSAEIEELELDLPHVFQMVSGPNRSTSMTIINGDVSQSTSVSYRIKPLDIGSEYVPPLLVVTSEGTVETQPIRIDTYPNPLNLIQEDQSEESEFPSLFDSFNMDDFFNFKIPEVEEAPVKKSKRPLKKI